MKETVLSIIKVIFAQLVLMAVVILLASFITYKLKVSDFGYKVIVMVVYGIVTFIGGMIIGKVKNKRKFLWGALTGGIYIGMIMIVAFAIAHNGESSVVKMVPALITSLAGGMLGGMAGLCRKNNMKKRFNCIVKNSLKKYIHVL